MSIEFIFRLIGMIVLAVVGVYWGIYLGRMTGGIPELYAVVFGLVGALVGLVLTPFVTTRPARYLRSVLSQGLCADAGGRLDRPDRRFAHCSFIILPAFIITSAVWTNLSVCWGAIVQLFWRKPVYHSPE